ncbi:transcriptional regulator, IclR family [Haloechinothrix alba]|uniref:Transcriptional regulator, IclR family n=1 Tax=Haloechinothrix alba TaxID=664784 RepID=A0A238VK68_9PSEU|nr:IclR family transcriptional regulator C-terminal domain-containing protein [Haloechinothrix alba]SNR34800.1 transcriptional regulator, IclR family [Haloechinothrix alba]
MGGTPQERPGRRLKTASEALHALRMLGATPEGVSAEQLAIELGKSASTARYLLNTLCHEGFANKDDLSGRYRLRDVPPWGQSWGQPGSHGCVTVPDELADAVTRLYSRTRKRSYLAHLEGEKTVVLDARGHQGLARIPGLQERISPSEAHALAVTKMLVSANPELAEVIRTESTLASFTGMTITDPKKFASEIDRIRTRGYAIDREEFAEDFCCIAAPVFDPAGEVAASLAISVGTRQFTDAGAVLVNEVIEVAAEATQQWRERQDSRDEELLLS